MSAALPHTTATPKSKLTGDVGFARANHAADILWLKDAMWCLGRYNGSADQDLGIDPALLAAIERYQRDRGLQCDGMLRPLGETEQTIRVELIRLGEESGL